MDMLSDDIPILGNTTVRLVTTTLIGGLTSEIGSGSFARGAAISFSVALLNGAMHEGEEKTKYKSIEEKYSNTGIRLPNKESFLHFLHKAAKHFSVEISGGVFENESCEQAYIISAWDLNKNNEAIMRFNVAYFKGKFSLSDLIEYYHTHPRSTGPSFDDYLGNAGQYYEQYTIGANGNIWHVYNPDILHRMPWGHNLNDDLLPSYKYYGKIIKKL